MSSLSIRGIKKRFGPVEVLKGIDIELASGEFLVLLGSSGCGKSTLLNIIAGLIDPSEGELLIGDRDITDVHPKDRDIAMVFQSYALYPNMTVARNLTFGLEIRKVDDRTREAALKRVATLLQIEHLLDRKPAQLSGGQRQRVAIGRALVREPKVFLFDEPLSNLDAKLRAEMRTEIKKLHQRLGTTIVYVTHDQIEAMTLASRIAIMRDGVVQQFAPPEEIYERPANMYVASFIGSPAMNFLRGRLEPGDGGSVGPRGRDGLAALAPGAAERAERAGGDARHPAGNRHFGQRRGAFVPRGRYRRAGADRGRHHGCGFRARPPCDGPVKAGGSTGCGALGAPGRRHEPRQPVRSRNRIAHCVGPEARNPTKKLCFLSRSGMFICGCWLVAVMVSHGQMIAEGEGA